MDAQGGDAPLAKVGYLPVGASARVKSDGAPIMLSQPQEDTFVAFSAVWTHQGCTAAADGERFSCLCHGSVYDAANSTMRDGPAPCGLKQIPVEVNGDDIVASE